MYRRLVNKCGASEPKASEGSLERRNGSAGSEIEAASVGKIERVRWVATASEARGAMPT